MERWDGNEAGCAAARCRTLLSDELAASCRKTPQRAAWLERLPGMIGELARRWSLALGAPFDSSAAWVAPAERGDGRRVVLKIGMPHMKSAHEIDGLRWHCRGRMRAAPDATMRRFAELLEVEPARVRLWMFARAAAEPRDVWDGELFDIARALKP